MGTLQTLNVRREGPVLFASIAAPPMNLLGPELVRDLVSLIQQAEADNAAKVLVFRSGDPDYFISHVDVTRIEEYRGEAAKLIGEASIGLLFRRLSASQLVSIAQILMRIRSQATNQRPADRTARSGDQNSHSASFQAALRSSGRLERL